MKKLLHFFLFLLLFFFVFPIFKFAVDDLSKLFISALPILLGILIFVVIVVLCLHFGLSFTTTKSDETIYKLFTPIKFNSEDYDDLEDKNYGKLIYNLEINWDNYEVDFSKPIILPFKTIYIHASELQKPIKTISPINGFTEAMLLKELDEISNKLSTETKHYVLSSIQIYISSNKKINIHLDGEQW